MSEVLFTPITWRENEPPALDAANLNRIEGCLEELVSKANAYDGQPHIRFAEMRYDNVALPSTGYVGFSQLPEGLPDTAEGENIVSAQIYNWGTISPAAAVSVGPRYIFGAPGTTISFAIVYFAIASGGWPAQAAETGEGA